MLRVGIISANWGAMAHLPAWRAVPGVEVVGICTSRKETAEAARERTGIPRAFWDAQEMIADPEIDIIDCGTRPSVRHPMVLSALQQGKHVYNGIPFAANFDAARELHEAWKASSAVGVADAYSQWLPAHRRAKEMIAEGFLGQPFGGSAVFNLALFNRPHPMFPWNWFAEAGHGVSAMRNLGSHMSHVLVDLFGEIEEVVAHDAQNLAEWEFPDGAKVNVETNDYVNMIVRFKSGMTLHVQTCWTTAVRQGWRIEAFGSGGRMMIEAPNFPTTTETTLKAGAVGTDSLELVEMPERLVRPDNISVGPEVQPEAAHGMAMSMQNMVEAIQTGAPAAPDFGQAWAVERLLEAARLSSMERRWVRIDDVA